MIDLYNPSESDNGHNTPERTNVWFFNGGGSLQATAGVGDEQDLENGTYEHPYTGSEFNQENLAKIYQDTILSGAYSEAYLYFNPGTYNAYNTDIYGTNYTHIELYEHESLWGRMGAEKGFQEPATGTSRPNFIGGLQLDSNTSINNVILHNNYAITGFDAGVIMNNATNVEINNSEIGVDEAGDADYHTGVNMQNDSSLSISDSQIYGYNTDAAGNGVGIKVTNGGNINAINNSKIIGTGGYDGMGIEVAANAAGDATIGSISGDKTAKFIGRSIDNNHNTYGLYAAGQNVQIGSIYDSNFIGDGGQAAYGLYANSSATTGNANTTIGTITGSSFEATEYKYGYLSRDADAYGLYANSTADTGNASTTIDMISKSTFDGTTNKPDLNVNGDAYGLYAGSSSTSGNAATTINNITDSEFDATANQSRDYAYGLYAGSNADQGTATALIGSINHSNFHAYIRSSYESYGLDIESTSETGNSQATILEISNSNFIGDGMLGYGFNAKSISNSGNANVNIDYIVNSSFESTAEGNGGIGFSARTYSNSGQAKTEIGTIEHSNFIGQGNGNYRAGFEAESNSTTSNSKTYIDEVVNSTFSSTTTEGSDAYGFIAASNGPAGSVTINTMTNNTFTAENEGLKGNVYGVYFSGDSIDVANNTDPYKIINYLESAASGNNFNISVMNRDVCVNLPGNTVCF